MRKWGCLILLVLGATSEAHALTVTVDHPAGGDTPPEIAYSNGGGLPLEVTLQLSNNSEDSSLPVFVWQVGLQLDAGPVTQGDVWFEEVFVADDSLFGDLSAPFLSTDTPSRIVVSDADLLANGVGIPGGSARNILKLELGVSEDAVGLFALTMSGFDETDLDNSSSWLPAGEVLVQSFENTLNSADGQSIVLATIRVMRVPEPSSAVLLLFGAVVLFPRLVAMRRADV